MPTSGAGGGTREPAAWDDPAGRVLASLGAAGVPVAERRYGPGEPLYGEGDPDGNLHFVVSGSVRVYKRYGPRGLRREGVLGVGERGGVVVLDREALARVASPACTRMRERVPAYLRA